MAEKYNEYKNADLAGIGKSVLSFWKENNLFEQSVALRAGKPTFTFFEGPPSANGTPGIHHVMARTVKDVFCRYKTMQGFQVKRKGGWDTHGLPVELQVEKELGITKEDIGKKITVEAYNQKCREAVMKYTSQWDELTEKMGYWVDLNDPYITYENNYIESIWYLLKELYQKNLLYKGFTIQPYSPAAGTGLSSHELNQPGCYRDVKDTSAVAQFKLNQKSFDAFQKIFSVSESQAVQAYFLAWTTTPWTLPSNSALAVGENITYVLVHTYNPYTFEEVYVVLAKDLLGKYFSDKAKEISFADFKKGDKLIPFEIKGEVKGKQLLGLYYEQLMPYVTPEGDAFKVIPGDFVSTEDGTGIVHIAPTFGSDDARVAKAAGIPAITVKDDKGTELPLVDRQGKFVKEVSDFAEEFVKEAFLTDEEKEAAKIKQGRDKYLNVDERIAIKLKESNRAFKVEKYEHSYPHCWRTDKPVLYYPLDSWFIRTTAKKERLVELNKTINWKPEHTGSGRFGNWLENLVDWNLSRSRYWGTPLPIWRTEDGSEELCIGSIDELKAEIEKAKKAGLSTSDDVSDLHRPYVDNIILVSPKGQPMYRETDLIDVWFDSGAMPYAQWHWPFENKDIFDSNYPADFIAEGVDQTRGWFFTLHALAVLLFDQVAYKNVIANGLVLDKNGNKMSKRLGNVVNPFETLDTYGPDATRWYMIVNAPPWDNLKFNLEGVTEVQRRFFGTLQNTYNFFALYANLDQFTYSEADIPSEQRTESDRWILSKLQSLIISVENALNEYEPTRAGRAIQDFVVDDLSNWYVRLNRKRFWKGEYNTDKISAYQTLYTCLETVARLSAPIAPFYMERLFNDLNSISKKHSVISIHLTDFPKANHSLKHEVLEERMQLAQTISSLVHSIRKAQNIKVRQPLSKIMIPILQPRVKEQIQAVEDLIKTEVNIKQVNYIEDTDGIVVKTIKPNFKKLGKEYGPKLKAIGEAVQLLQAKDISELEKNNIYNLILTDGTSIQLTLEDVEIRTQDIPGWSVATETGITVALDISISDELKLEGIARDVVNRVQNIRKDSGMDVQDKIKIDVLKTNTIVDKALIENLQYICVETQAHQLNLVDELMQGTPVELDEFTLTLKISK